MKITIQNKSVYASDAGQGIENSKDTIVFLHGSGLSHIVWSLTEQFFSNKNFNVLSNNLGTLLKERRFLFFTKKGPIEVVFNFKHYFSALIIGLLFLFKTFANLSISSLE